MSFVAVLQLRQLDISNNSITGFLPSSWGNLTQVSTTTTVCVLVILGVRQCTTLWSTENDGKGFAV